MMKLSPACDHRFPLRVIVPGYAAVRNVQWLSKIEISKSEAEGAWQEGLNYKILPPSVTDANNVDLKKMPSMSEVAVFRGITNMEMAGRPKLKPGKTIMVKTNGWAWSGGGRNIVRVDIFRKDSKKDCMNYTTGIACHCVVIRVLLCTTCDLRRPSTFLSVVNLHVPVR